MNPTSSNSRLNVVCTAAALVVGLAQALKLPAAEPIHLDPRITLVVFGFALMGCYVGAGIRRRASVRG